ncbi:MAG: hypothetical protein IPP37_03380 [Saprospiraceae bacterium]|nr:hypothetical protein [Saprospiraceae bacterium]MBK9687692.1 hypothetical protein [Saprospiraceae bacterium]MBL0081523.1 hypothetical protein [Saprospiraceae bacterium]
MKKYIWYLLMAVLAGGAYGYYQYNRPVASLESANADVVLEAPALLKAFETNETTANTQYLDKVIEVSGQISRIEEDGEKKSIYLSTGNEMSSVICEMESASSTEGLAAGSKVVVKGKCTGYLMDVVLVQSVVKK